MNAGETVGVVGRTRGRDPLPSPASVYAAVGRRSSSSARRAAAQSGSALQRVTGREKHAEGDVLGFSEPDAPRTPRIVEWAELEEFIDAPIRTYSSGMAARLAFSVATDVEPEILLVDEALAVGDEGFQLKCHQRIEDFRKEGKTVLFVSHALAQVRENCRRAVWIHEGRLIRDGEVGAVTELYHRWSMGEQVALPQAL